MYETFSLKSMSLRGLSFSFVLLLLSHLEPFVFVILSLLIRRLEWSPLLGSKVNTARCPRGLKWRVCLFIRMSPLVVARRTLLYHIDLISRITTHRFILHIRNVGLQWLFSTAKINLREYSLGNSVDCKVVGSNSLRDCWAKGKEIMRKASKKKYSTKGVWKI